ncbi:MAG: cyclic nucleotide-binding domain-containing protein [Saprospiraceae bacterium]|nr:cyclic nucleotide-binding domain-containing protein [Saprospiraceae bacterium]MCB9318774.1 cyclic nucleotide-binding domain-containing protein [Lewinellaceae bacterium]
MDLQDYLKALNHLLQINIENITEDEKTRLLQKHIELYHSRKEVLGFNLTIIPFIPGRRSFDEAFYPGLGSSEETALYTHKAESSINFLYRIFQNQKSVNNFPDNAILKATITVLNHQGKMDFIVPAWNGRLLKPIRKGEAMNSEPAVDPHRDAVTENVSEAWTLTIPIDELVEDIRQAKPHQALFEFASLFFERLKLQLDLQIEDVIVSSDYHYFEIYNESLFGSLYKRLIEQLLPWDLNIQLTGVTSDQKIGIDYHPWIPVLCIGTEKANLYMKAIFGDMVEEKRMLTDPGWLLRVGLYLELLTCLGIIEVAKQEGLDLLSSRERKIFGQLPSFEAIRNRIDVKAWKKVWAARKIAVSGVRPNKNMPVSFGNLLRKKTATLMFLHAHHEDLKQAIELAGVNVHNSQETWHRVFRDAERAVLKMDEQAFPELNFLTTDLKKFVLWHERGNYFGLKLIPKQFSRAFGDQDGLYLSACRNYRNSMNEVAEWAKSRGLMEYTGKECVPASASILENYLAKNYGRLKYLQNQDGYLEGLDVKDREEAETRFPVEDIYNTLSRVSIFKALHKDELQQLAQRARPIELGHLERIIVQDREGSSLFVLHEGSLEVVGRIQEVDQVLALLQKGAVVGEFSFLTGEKRTAAVRAIDYALVFEVSAANLRPLVEKRPGIIQELTRIMEERKKANDENVNEKSLMNKITSTILGKTRTYN